MSLPAYTRFPLQPHPATPCADVHRLWASLHSAPSGALTLRYELVGDLARLRIPAPSTIPTSADRLWRHTCFEAFIGHAAQSRYREFNFSPSGQWATYDFDAERVRAANPPSLPAPQIRIDRRPDAFVLTAALAAHTLSVSGNAPALLGLTAVVETLEGALSYWALAHPNPAPDFHARAGWTERLPLF